MKIKQLLEYPQDVASGSPLARARARDQARANSADPNIGGIPNLNTGLPQATTRPQPTTLGAPAVNPTTSSANPTTSSANPVVATTPPNSNTSTASTPAPNANASIATPNTNTSGPSLSQRIAQGIGGIGQAVGAVAGIPSGIGRAFSQGKEAGASAIGGAAVPSTGKSSASGAPAATADNDEVAQLKSQLQVMQQKLIRAGIQ